MLFIPVTSAGLSCLQQPGTCNCLMLIKTSTSVAPRVGSLCNNEQGLYKYDHVHFEQQRVAPKGRLSKIILSWDFDIYFNENNVIWCNPHHGAWIHVHKVKSLVLYQLSSGPFNIMKKKLCTLNCWQDQLVAPKGRPITMWWVGSSIRWANNDFALAPKCHGACLQRHETCIFDIISIWIM